jgi:ribosomal protein S18 acetylase RimI-like enzyme
MTNIHPRHREQVSPVLFYNLAQDQARTMLAEGVNQVRTISVEPPTENLLDSLGFKVTQVQWRMLYVFSEPPQQPVFPPGYHLMPFESAKYAREVFEVIETAFSELPHRRGNTFEGWKHFILDRSDFELNLLKMVVKDNEVAAVAVGFDNDLGGWVRQLAVKKVHRGKGLASCLLKQLFFEFYQHGRKDVGLVVDSENLTGAPELYRKAGMQATEKYVTFVKKVLSTTIREDKTSAYEGGI